MMKKYLSLSIVFILTLSFLILIPKEVQADVTNDCEAAAGIFHGNNCIGPDGKVIDIEGIPDKSNQSGPTVLSWIGGAWNAIVDYIRPKPGRSFRCVEYHPQNPNVCNRYEEVSGERPPAETAPAPAAAPRVTTGGPGAGVPSSDLEIITSKICEGLTGEALTECKNPTGCKLEYTGFIREHDLASFQSCVLDHKKVIVDKSKKAKNIQEQLKEEYGAWVGAHCASVWTIHKGKDTPFDDTNGSKCEAAVARAGCQNLPPDDDPEHPKLVSCIRTAADRSFKPPSVPARVESPRGPVPTPAGPAGQVSDEFISALGAWCAAACGEDKKATCQDQVGFACEKQSDFKKCIEDEAKKLCPASAPPPAPPAPAAPSGTSSVVTPVITVQALINGLQKVDLFTGVGKVTFSAKITANNNPRCVKMLTSFELRRAQKNELITLPISNTTSCEGYDINLDELKLTQGEYELSVKPNNQSPAKATFSLKSAAPTPTESRVFYCTTMVKPEDITPTEIKASVEGSHPSYDRINWYIGKESLELKGTNKPGDITKFDVEPNTTYKIQAEYYSQDVSQKRAPYKCVPPKDGVKTPVSKQDRRVQKSNPRKLAAVLGTHTSPISFDVIPSVSPPEVVAVNVRAAALDLNGNEGETLFNDIWENGRPLPLTINNPSQLSAVKVTVSMVDETNQFSSSADTSYIPISSSENEIDQTRQDVPQSFYLLTSPDLAVLEQSIRNGQSSITFIASSEHPVSHPSFSINGEKVAPDSILCADKQLGPCGYHLTLYAPFVGEYSVGFEDQVVRFSAPEPVSEVSQNAQSTQQEGGGGVTDLIKITISKEDGTDPQVIYENGQFNPAEFANLVEGDNRLIVTKQYSNGQTKTDYMVVRRKTQMETEKQQPHEEQPEQIPEKQVSPPPQEPASTQKGESAFSHRSCGDISGNVIVDVYSDGSEVAGTNCEDLGQVCTLFDNEGRQDATCVDK